MSARTQIIGILSVFAVLMLIVELVRRRQLRTGYSILWLLAGLAAAVLILFDDLLVIMSDLMGIVSPTSLLFTAGVGTALLISLGQSLALTRLWRQNKDLALEHALLQGRLEQLKAGQALEHALLRWQIEQLKAGQEEREDGSTLASPELEALLTTGALRGMELPIPAKEEAFTRSDLSQYDLQPDSA
jgi:hypothetical protein